MTIARPPDAVQRRNPGLVRFFSGVMRRQMRKNFHAVRIARDGFPRVIDGRPVIVYLNHPSWWDPAFVMVLARSQFPHRPGFGPIDAEALARYRFMARIGLFGVTRDSGRGAAAFLRQSRAILQNPDAMLWVTAEGHFTDARTRPVRLRPGIAHLAARTPEALLVPLALDYTFWDERKPEALCRFGPPLDTAAAPGRSVKAWQAVLDASLETEMDRLAGDARSRDAARFTVLVDGGAGIGGVYDLWRRGRAWAGGRPFHAGHGQPEETP
jgi:1-acyl-sn-glycerol-3-phosphate acyltransferase